MNKKVAVARIRYNTESNGEDLCWRLVLDGEEVLVDAVHINAPTFTSRDWVEPVNKFKHHISIQNCQVDIDEDGIALITPAV